MTRTMYDSVDVTSLPGNGQLYAGYLDGSFANLPAIRGRFPHAVIVEIVVTAANNDGNVLDVEQYDASPSEAPGWVQRRRAAGVDPSVYCNSSTWPAVQAAFKAAGVAEPHYWIAQYDGDPTIPAGAVAKQYQDNGGYDSSSVADYWPGIDPQEIDMPLSAADLTAIRSVVDASLEAHRAELVDDNLYYWADALKTGKAPAGATPVAVQSIKTIYQALQVLAAEPVPVTTVAAAAAAAESAAGAALEQAGKALESTTPPAAAPPAPAKS